MRRVSPPTIYIRRKPVEAPSRRALVLCAFVVGVSVASAVTSLPTTSRADPARPFSRHEDLLRPARLPRLDPLEVTTTDP
jgi:hypothetical protein